MGMSSYAPSRTFLRPGELGELAAKLGGSISPCASCTFRGLELLFIVVASGARNEDGGPAWRRLAALVVEDGRIVDFRIVVEHFPNKGKLQDDEEGAFSAAPVVNGDRLELFVGEIVWRSPGSVDVRTALYRSDNGVDFRRVATITELPAVEVGPLAAYLQGNALHVFEFFKQRSGWQTWQLGFNGRQVDPLILTSGASGPFELADGRLGLNVVRYNGTAGPEGRLLVPHSEWWTFDRDRPWDFRFESAGMLTRAIAPDGSVAYALDSQHLDAELLELRPVEDPGFLELARPYRLVSDPRLWKPTAAITELRWRGGNLELDWDGVREWGFHTNNPERRAIYGNIVFGYYVDGEPVITSVEYLANRRGAPNDDVDTVFEHLGTEGNELALGKILQRGEEFFICAAAPCRPEGTAGYPRDVGLLPQRTRWIRARYLEDGFEDAEPASWWQGSQPEIPEGSNMKLSDVRSYSAAIEWQRQEQAFEPGSPGTAEVEETIHVVGDEPVWLIAVGGWIGLFGGIPSRDESPDAAFDFYEAKKAGQVQEIGLSIYGYPHKGTDRGGEPRYGARRTLYETGLHQLDPSGSFGDPPWIYLPTPIELSPGDKITVRSKTSQKDRGAHTRAKILVSEVDPAA